MPKHNVVLKPSCGRLEKPTHQKSTTLKHKPITELLVTTNTPTPQSKTNAEHKKRLPSTNYRSNSTKVSKTHYKQIKTN